MTFTNDEITLIEFLKNNDKHQIFADMPLVEQELLLKMSNHDLEHLSHNNGELTWKVLGNLNWVYPVGIYRIKSDFKSEPEKKELKKYIITTIVVRGIVFYVFTRFNHDFYPHEATRMKGFRGFQDKTGYTTYDAGAIPSWIECQGWEVYALFEE